MLATDDQLMRPVKVIRLTQGQCTIVDPEDYEYLISLGPWHVQSLRKEHRFVAAREVWIKEIGRSVTVLMTHDIILTDHIIDHKNGDRLDNRRSNLRACDYFQNSTNTRIRSDNTSGYKGVSWDKTRRKWRAYFVLDGYQIHLGRYTDPIQAAHAYDEAARLNFGEFACLNFPLNGEQGARKEVVNSGGEHSYRRDGCE